MSMNAIVLNRVANLIAISETSHKINAFLFMFYFTSIHSLFRIVAYASQESVEIVLSYDSVFVFEYINRLRSAYFRNYKSFQIIFVKNGFSFSAFTHI